MINRSIAFLLVFVVFMFCAVTVYAEEIEPIEVEENEISDIPVDSSSSVLDSEAGPLNDPDSALHPATDSSLPGDAEPLLTQAQTTETRTLRGRTITFYAPENGIEKVIVYGNTTFEGTDTPAPDNLYTLDGITDTSFKVNDNAYSMPLEWPLLEGAYRDSTGVEYHAMKYLEAQTVSWSGSGSETRIRLQNNVSAAEDRPESHGYYSSNGELCSHFVTAAPSSTGMNVFCTWDNGSSVNIFFNRAMLSELYGGNGTVANAVAWIQEQAAAGTPIKMAYKLATPRQMQKEALTITNDDGLVTITSNEIIEVVATVYTDMPITESEDGNHQGGEDPTPTDPTQEARPFLTTPLNDFTVTEGLLLLLVIGFALFGTVRLFSR